MPDSTSDLLQIAFAGPALEEGRMPMAVLGAALRGQGLLIERVGQLLYGDAYVVRAEINSDFETGSLVAPVHIVVEGLQRAEHLLAGDGVTAVANLLQLLGFFGVSAASLYNLFKRNKGRRIQDASGVPRDPQIDVAVDLLVAIYNDPEVQKQIRRTLEPLHSPGIEKFETRRSGVVVQTVRKSDLEAADEAEIADTTQDEEVTLDIEKVAWRRNLAWHFNDGRTSFDAKIEDDTFWKNMSKGVSFADGDRMRVHLQTTVHRTRQGTLKVQRVIPEVIAIERASRRTQQIDLFDQGQ